MIFIEKANNKDALFLESFASLEGPGLLLALMGPRGKFNSSIKRVVVLIFRTTLNSHPSLGRKSFGLATYSMS